ncbi:response regulator [Halobacteriovorax sp. GB3]|uniref:response regulator n=1 Tax=Halobacteriovorax sp. GB3 TaxID=2719615 RepID=UPI0023627F32|nr:response regulator [Halobacteriovorax sp. GB3]MDD0854545.1 response regulator [Halobacteriovorax sp. GB3]
MSNTRNQEFKIVVVDDSDIARNATVSLLEKHGFNVVGSADNAEKGLQLAASTGAQLYLIDVVMPKIGGIELAKNILELKTGVYIIMTSSLDMESIVIESVSTGALDFLTKPFSEEDLIKSVSKIEYEFEKES